MDRPEPTEEPDADGSEREPEQVRPTGERAVTRPPPVAVLLVAMFVAAAVYAATRTAFRPAADRYTSAGEYFSLRCLDVVVIGWLLWTTSAIGSFLNVVAYRVPLGRSLGGRSHCPHCDTALAGRDNVPVLGWFAIGGRCRHCGHAVSPRYPIVEFLVGTTLTAMLATLVFNLPRPHHHPIYGGTFEHADLSWSNLTTMAAVLACGFGVWALALMCWDGTTPATPWMIAVPAFIAVAYVLMPSSMKVRMRWPSKNWFEISRPLL